jgi:hypothetical protein
MSTRLRDEREIVRQTPLSMGGWIVPFPTRLDDHIRLTLTCDPEVEARLLADLSDAQKEALNEKVRSVFIQTMQDVSKIVMSGGRQ